jgi:hypothetical protein
MRITDMTKLSATEAVKGKPQDKQEVHQGSERSCGNDGSAGTADGSAPRPFSRQNVYIGSRITAFELTNDGRMSSRAEYLDLLRETLGAIQYDFHSHTQANPGPEDLRKGHLSLIANVAKITTTIQALAKERQRHVSSVTTEETIWGGKVKDISTLLHDKGQKVGGQIAIALSGKGDPDDPFWQDITNPDLNPTVENTASIDLLSWADTVEKQERGVKKLVRALPRCDEHI